MLDISHEKINDRSYLEGVFEFDNYKDKRLEKYQPYLKDKISQQFKHYGTNINDVKAGNIAMKKDWLKPKFVVKHVIIPKEKLKELWGNY